MFGLPALEGLRDLFDGESPQMLDVGVGVAAMAVECSRTFPRLRVVGLDVLPRALELARRLVDEAGLADRIELRHLDVASLADDRAYALAWLPAPFVPRPALNAGLRHFLAKGKVATSSLLSRSVSLCADSHG